MSSLSILARNTQLTAMGVLLADGYFQARTGTQPTSVEDSATGTLIATIDLDNPALLTPSGGVASLAITGPGTCVNDADVNNITWGRFYDSSNNAVLDCSITVFGGGGEVIASKVNPLTGESVTITFTWTIPEHP